MKWLGRILASWGFRRENERLRPGLVPGLLDHVAFERELRRQRALADRFGGSFMLLTFDAARNPARTGAGFSPAALGRILMERVRLSDVAGVYGADGTTLGVVLANTDGEGADRVLASVQDLLDSQSGAERSSIEEIVCSVSCYPSLERFVGETESSVGRVIASVEHEVRPANVGRV